MIIGRDAVANDLGKNVRATRTRAFIIFQRQDRGSLPENEAGARAVEVGIFRSCRLEVESEADKNQFRKRVVTAGENALVSAGAHALRRHGRSRSCRRRRRSQSPDKETQGQARFVHQRSVSAVDNLRSTMRHADPFDGRGASGNTPRQTSCRHWSCRRPSIQVKRSGRGRAPLPAPRSSCERRGANAPGAADFASGSSSGRREFVRLSCNGSVPLKTESPV